MARDYVQAKDYRLAGAGVGSTDTSITLSSMTFPNSGDLVTMDDFGEIGFATLEPETNREENVSFTGITQNINGTATLTGVTRGLKFARPPYGQDINLRRSHSGGTILRISNSAQFYYNLANKYNEETIVDKWTFPSVAGDTRPVLGADTDAILNTELVTKGEVTRLIQATFLPPVVVSTSQGSTNLVQGQITPFAHTVPVGLTSGGTFVIVHTQEDVTVSSITLGAQNFTQVATETRPGSNQRIEIWRLLNPASGTANVTVTTSGNAYSTAQVITLENVNQTTPVDALSTGADGSGTAVADTITTATANAVILMGVGGDTDPTVFTPTAPLAEILVDDAGTLRPTSSSVRSTTTAGVYNLAYTIAPSQDFVTKAIAIRGVQVPGIAGVNSVTDDGNGVVTVDNTDPANPVIEFQGVNTDGVTITGDGTAGNPLVAVGGGVGTFAKRMFLSIPNGAVNGNYTYAHGLGTTPSYGTLTLHLNENWSSDGYTDFAGDDNCVYWNYNTSTMSNSATLSFYALVSAGVQRYGTITADSTNITVALDGSSTVAEMFIVIDIYT